MEICVSTGNAIQYFSFQINVVCKIVLQMFTYFGALIQFLSTDNGLQDKYAHKCKNLVLC